MLETVLEWVQGEEFCSLKPVLLGSAAAVVWVRRNPEKLISNE
ncbi:hypothetical protein [Polaromonas sp.]